MTTSGYRGDPALPALHGHLKGARAATGGRLEVILQRRRALERALKAAAPGDAVVIPGRGALTAMTPDPRGLPIPFDDREVVREILRSL
jgi:UDP-N-acetylmuramyl tripeptide synthase